MPLAARDNPMTPGLATHRFYRLLSISHISANDLLVESYHMPSLRLQTAIRSSSVGSVLDLLPMTITARPSQVAVVTLDPTRITLPPTWYLLSTLFLKPQTVGHPTGCAS